MLSSHLNTLINIQCITMISTINTTENPDDGRCGFWIGHMFSRPQISACIHIWSICNHLNQPRIAILLKLRTNCFTISNTCNTVLYIVYLTYNVLTIFNGALVLHRGHQIYIYLFHHSSYHTSINKLVWDKTYSIPCAGYNQTQIW